MMKRAEDDGVVELAGLRRASVFVVLTTRRWGQAKGHLRVAGLACGSRGDLRSSGHEELGGAHVAVEAGDERAGGVKSWEAVGQDHVVADQEGGRPGQRFVGSLGRGLDEAAQRLLGAREDVDVARDHLVLPGDAVERHPGFVRSLAAEVEVFEVRLQRRAHLVADHAATVLVAPSLQAASGLGVEDASADRYASAPEEAGAEVCLVCAPFRLAVLVQDAERDGGVLRRRRPTASLSLATPA